MVSQFVILVSNSRRYTRDGCRDCMKRKAYTFLAFANIVALSRKT